MKRLFPLSIVLAMLVGAIISSPKAANGQSAGLVSAVLNRNRPVTSAKPEMVPMTVAMSIVGIATWKLTTVGAIQSAPVK